MRRVFAFPTFLLLGLTASIALIAGPAVGATARPDALTDTHVAPAGFTAPHRVVGGAFDGVAEVVDSANHVHLAATGKGGVWYMTDRSGGWTAHRILTNPHSGAYTNPLIAIDEHDRVYIAATKWVGPEVPTYLGSFYVTDKGRARGTFPSTPTRIAPAGKGAESLKVANGHIYAALDYAECCVSPDWPPVWFRTNASGSWVTTKLGNGQSPSMRLPTNGHARIVYSGQSGLQYAVAATASGSFSKVRIPSTTGKDSWPLLSLDTSGSSAVAWFHDNGSAGWTERYSTRKSGSWSAPLTVASSLNGFDAVSFDMDTLGRANVVIANSDDQMLRDMRLVGSSWTSLPIAGPVAVNAVSVRRAAAGVVVVAWATNTGIWVSMG